MTGLKEKPAPAAMKTPIGETPSPPTVATAPPASMPVAGAENYVPAPFANLIQRFTEDMERLFSDFGVAPGRYAFTPTLFRKGRQLLTRGLEGMSTAIPWTPRIEVCTKGDQFVCSCELPGLTKNDVKVEIADGVLTIHGEKKNTVEKTAVGTYHSEYTYGSFYRQIPLPDGCDIDKAAVTFVNGLLTVTVPLPAGSRCRTRCLEIKEG